MTKTELEEKIKNGDSVWVGLCDKIDLNRYLIELRPNMIASKEFKNELGLIENVDIGEWEITIANNIEITLFANGTKWGFSILDVYKDELEAKHIILHKGITRTEYLPFLTWEEFLKEKDFSFIDKYGVTYHLSIFRNKIIRLLDFDIPEMPFVVLKKPLTEENFYKAYDECVKLFMGE